VQSDGEDVSMVPKCVVTKREQSLTRSSVGDS
jgi:hypothetical protein